MFFRSIPEYEVAKQIASLVNANNGLSLKRRSIDIVEGRVNYIVETHGNLVLGAVGIDRVSFTFSEIKHLVVRPDWRCKGIGRFITKKAISLVDTPLIYCTVRTDNEASIRLFEGLGFSRADGYKAEGHNVILLTRTSPKWEKKCLKSTWKPTLSSARMLAPLDSEPLSWGSSIPTPPEEGI